MDFINHASSTREGKVFSRVCYSIHEVDSPAHDELRKSSQLIITSVSGIIQY